MIIFGLFSEKWMIYVLKNEEILILQKLLEKKYDN